MIQGTVSGQLASIEKLDLGMQMATESMYQATEGIVKNQEQRRSAGPIMWVIVALVATLIVLVIIGL